VRNFIQKALVASSVATAGVVAAATASFAQAAPVNQTITFDGTVASTCTFANDAPGTVALDPNDGNTLTSAGAPGSVELTCTGNATLDIADPTQAAGPALTTPTLNSEATFDDGSGVNTILGGDPAVNLAGAVTDMPITVNMTATSADPIESGNYTFNVVLTAAPL